MGNEENPEGESGDEEDEDADDDAEGEMVGYLEKRPTDEERMLLTRRMFPSKVGGKPAWLVPRGLPTMPKDGVEPGSHADLACRSCHRPLRFLLQVYASRGYQRPEAFHRVLHVFVCTNCQPSEVRVFRAQLPRANDFYGEEAPDAEAIAAALSASGGADLEVDALSCTGCGLPHADATELSEPSQRRVCAECERRTRNGDGPALFEERELSTTEADVPDEDEDADVPHLAVGNDEVEEVFTPGVAEELDKQRRDLVAEADGVIEAAKRKGASAAVLEKLQEYRQKVSENAENAIDVSEQNVFDEWCKDQGEHDPVFSAFNRYAAANQGHVLRYIFDGRPLWYCTPGQLEADGPPPCSRCGAARVFEFQVQPQLIALLAGTTSTADRLDFGTVCCYVCGDSCDLSDGNSPYAEEFAFVQPEPHDAFLPKG